MSRRLLPLLLLFTPACLSSTTEEPPSTSYASASAATSRDYEQAVARGEIGTFVASPAYLHDTPYMAIYRGYKPGERPSSLKFYSSMSSSGRSKIDWSRAGSSDALLNMVRIDANGQQLLFPDTPREFIELAFLLPRATPSTTPAPPPPQPQVVQLTDASPAQTPVIDLHIHTSPPQAPATPPPAGPLFTEAVPGREHVADHLPYWQLPNLPHALALGCAVMRTPHTDADGEKGWRYHGEIWLRDLDGDRLFKHGDPALEPSSWQLHPGERPQLEVVMADDKGWPARVDLIDLTTLTVRSLPSIEELHIEE